ncbi:MAG: hypothetical protein WCK17_13955, partial [Verrucomicrobiota bacterium]
TTRTTSSNSCASSRARMKFAPTQRRDRLVVPQHTAGRSLHPPPSEKSAKAPPRRMTADSLSLRCGRMPPPATFSFYPSPMRSSTGLRLFIPARTYDIQRIRRLLRKLDNGMRVQKVSVPNGIH